MSKIAWKEIENGAPDLFSFIQSFSFRIDDYNDLMRFYARHRRFDVKMDLEVWPFVPVAKDFKDLLKPVGGHWSLIWDKTHHWGDTFFLVHCQPLTNRKAVQGTLNCFPIGQLVVPDLTISTQISNLFSHL